MQKSDFSPQFSSVWGKEADGAHLTYPIPPSSGDLGRASLSLGFPPATFIAPENGGSFVFGEDMNGILRMLAVSAQNYESGAWPVFSASFAQSIGGYPQDAVIADPAQADLYWRSTIDHNLTIPGESGAAWVSLLGDYLRLTTGDTQTVSGPVTFSTAPLVPLLEAGTRSDQTASTTWVGHELTHVLGDYLHLTTGDVQTVSGPVTFSTAPLVPLLEAGTRSDQTASTTWVGHELTHVLGDYLHLTTGDVQTVSGPVTFSTAPLVPLLEAGTRSDQTASTAWVGNEITRALNDSNLVTLDQFRLFNYGTGNGYRITPDGFVEQWGIYTTNSDGVTTVHFPINFPSKCMSIIVSEARAGGSWLSSQPTWHGVYDAPSTSEFTVLTRGFADNMSGRAVTATGYYQAIGY